MKNFGLIKTIFNDIMAESLVEKNNKTKEMYKKFIKQIKENKTLKKQFDVYELLENANNINDEDINFYIKESLSLLDNVSRKELFKENLNLFKPILENYPELEDIDYPEKKLHESISELIFTKKSVGTINKIVSHTNIVKENINKKPLVETVTENKKILPNSVLSNLMFERFSDKYSSFNDMEKIVFVSIVKENSDLQNDVFNHLNLECLTKVNDKLSKNSGELKETLLNVKEKLLTNQYVKENYQTSIIKLLDLYNDLE